MKMPAFGVELISMLQSQCLEGGVAKFVIDELLQPEGDAYDLGGDRCDSLALFEDDPYDPSKPEYIAPATQEEVERVNAQLLAKQIAKLEAHTARRRRSSRPDVILHYQSVLNALRSREPVVRGALASDLAYRRTHSAPNLAAEDMLATRTCTRPHADSACLASVAEDHIDDSDADGAASSGMSAQVVHDEQGNQLESTWSGYCEDAPFASRRLVALSFELGFL